MSEEFSDREIKDVLKDTFDFDDFKSKDQEQAAKLILSGEKNILISLPTHGGKTLCYQLPSSLQRDGIILVITPSISLITNHTAKLNELRIPAVSITSVISTDCRKDVIKSLYDYENVPYRFVYMTPEMLICGSAPTKDVIEFLMEQEQISHVVVDEAHCILDKGFSYRPAFTQLKSVRGKFRNIPWIAVTTASEKFLNELAASLSMTSPKILRGLSDRKNICYDVIKSDVQQLIFRSIIEDFLELDEEADSDKEFNFTRKVYSSGIIFCTTNEQADLIADGLSSEGVTAKSYYGAKQDVNVIQKEWKEGVFPVIVATTESFGFGINRTPLKFVVHLSHSKNLRAYYQESGRVDADVSYARIYLNRFFNSTPVGEIRDYIETKSCRHKYIAQFFGDDIAPCEKMCDNCKRGEI
jgi:RecQ family ATP-dependent DNA helicase